MVVHTIMAGLISSIMKANYSHNSFVADTDDDDSDDEQRVKPYEYFEQQVIRKVHHFFLNGLIGEAGHYTKMIHTIQQAGSEDAIHIHLNTEGGYLTTGVQIINAMKYSPAEIICSIEGEAHSLGSLIFLAADQFLVHDNSQMLIHNFTGGVVGKGKESADEMAATLKWFNILTHKYYIPFLSDRELKDVLNDKDMWLHSDDIRKRLTKMIRIKKKEDAE